MNNVLAGVQASLKRRSLDAVLVSQPDNRRFLSGYTALDHGINESSGHLLIPAKGSPFLLTDSRFQLQAEQQAQGFQLSIYSKGLIENLRGLLPELGIKRLGFESHYMLVSTFERLQKIAEKLGVFLQPLADLVERQREVKSEEQIAIIEKSVRLNEQVFQQIHATLQPGASEIEVALEIEALMRKHGAERPSFETIVAFGDNAAKPHAVPTERRLREGEIVLIDMGLVYRGYCSDMTRTFVVGKSEQAFVERLRVVRKAQLAAIAVIRDGAVCQDVDAAARTVIKQAGYGDYFGHALGHGVGLAVHEQPRLSSRSRKKLRSGMIVTVEPGIYIPDWGGIRLENMVVVSDEGCRLLNRDTTGFDV